MKVMISRKPKDGPWGGGNLFIKGLEKCLKSRGHQVFYEFTQDLDFIFMIDPRPSDYGVSVNEILQYKHYFPKTQIVHRINECDKRKGTNNLDPILLQCTDHVDHVIFISEWLQKYFIDKGLRRNDTSVVYNGCNTEHFNFKKNDKITTLSKVHLVTHHWSDNMMKGYDFYQKIDEMLPELGWEFTFIGRFCKDIKVNNINLIGPSTGHELAKNIKLGNIYITASKWEPCGMHHIEGAACGLPVVYHTDGGGINEGCARYGKSFSNLNTFIDAVNHIKENYKDYVENIENIDLSVKSCCEKYCEIVGL